MGVLDSTPFRVAIFPGALFAVCFGIFLTWLVRKTIAKTQWRVGPSLSSTFAEFLKLFSKESMVPKGSILFVLIPIFSTVVAAAMSLLLPLPWPELLSFRGDFWIFLFLFLFSSVLLVLTKFTSENPNVHIGAKRAFMISLSYDVVMIFALLLPMTQTSSFVLKEALSLNKLFFLPAAIVAFICLLAKTRLPPFDLPEAKTELMDGIYAEYSGPLLGLFRLSNAIQLYVLSALFVSLFLPTPTTAFPVLNLLIYLAEICLIVIVASIVSALNPRARIDQGIKFCWLYLAPLIAANFLILYLL